MSWTRDLTSPNDRLSNTAVCPAILLPSKLSDVSNSQAFLRVHSKILTATQQRKQKPVRYFSGWIRLCSGNNHQTPHIDSSLTLHVHRVSREPGSSGSLRTQADRGSESCDLRLQGENSAPCSYFMSQA